jgi:hypothetical protein
MLGREGECWRREGGWDFVESGRGEEGMGSAEDREREVGGVYRRGWNAVLVN